MTHAPTTDSARPINYAALTEVLLLSGTAALLMSKWQHGLLAYYIHPRYTPLVLLGALVLFLMGGVRLRDLYSQQGSRRITGLHVLLALPLLLGVLVPAQPLGAEILAGRGLDLSAVRPTLQQQVEGEPLEWNLLQWLTALAVRGDELQGASADVVGFVFQDERLGNDHFYVARYVITCCAADGSAAGLPVQWPDGSALPVDTWVRVQGTMATVTTSDGITIPAISATSVEPVDQPASPYLFP